MTEEKEIRVLPSCIYPDPKILFEEDPEIEDFYLGPYLGGIGGMISGAVFQAYSNFAFSRPYTTGLYKYVLYAAAFGAIGQFVQIQSEKYHAYRDSIYRHYLKLHPEDFPPPPKIKIGDILEDWYPTR